MTKGLLLVGATVLVACGSGAHAPAATPDPTIHAPGLEVSPSAGNLAAAAADGLKSVLETLKDGREQAFGFANADELPLAKLGPAYLRLYLEKPGAGGQTVNALQRWTYAVTVDGEYRCVIEVELMNGVWQAVGIGSTGFAHELQQLERDRPELTIASRALLTIVGEVTVLVINPTEESVSSAAFIFVPPSSSLVRYLPRYSSWTAVDPSPVLSFEELSVAVRGFMEYWNATCAQSNVDCSGG